MVSVLPEAFVALHNRNNNSVRILASLLAVEQAVRAHGAPIFEGVVKHAMRGLAVKFPELAAKVEQEQLDVTTGAYHSEACAAINAAVLVFAHSVADLAIDELLDLSAIAVPSEWSVGKEEFKLTLQEIKSLKVEEFEAQAVRRVVQRAKQRSLPDKVQRIFKASKCGPAELNIKLDSKVLAEADAARHEVVHGTAFTSVPQNFFDMLEALNSASLACLLAVAASCGLRLKHIEYPPGIEFIATASEE